MNGAIQMNYQEALDFIHGTYKFGSKLGLENVTYLLELLGNPQDKLKVIHIAGTNGKGSTAAYLHSILKEGGYRVGLYTSPYLQSFTERIQINGVNIPETRLAELTAIVKEKIAVMVKEGRNHPTEFEVVTALALLYYGEEEVDYLVLEVGLGGRLDATNVIANPLVSVITPIGYDHMQYLGDTLEKIAFEKAGIIKANGFTVTYPQTEGVIDVFKEVCGGKNNRLFVTSLDALEIKHSGIDFQLFSANIQGKHFRDIKIQLVGNHQIYNCCTALTAIEVLRRERGLVIEDDAVYRGLFLTRWPGRMEVLRKKPLTIIDGAHNIHGAEALRTNIEKLLKGYCITLVIGMLEDKDIDGFLKLIIPAVDKVIATKPNNPRGLAAEVLRERIMSFNKPLFHYEEVSSAIQRAFEITSEEGAILFAGSLYMIGEVREVLKAIDIE